MLFYFILTLYFYSIFVLFGAIKVFFVCVCEVKDLAYYFLIRDMYDWPWFSTNYISTTLSQQLETSIIVPTNANLTRVLQCDLCGEGHANVHCVAEGYIEDTYYTWNYQDINPYSKTFNMW